jgi:DNA-binding transcriptional ArsR family regulator
MDAAGLVDAGLLARAAGLLADRSRAAFCLALLDGRAWTAVELARHVGVAASTASEHLSTLVAAGLLAEERQGRHRYLRLAGPGVAQLLEDIGGLTGVPAVPRSLRGARVAARLAAARTCYDHLAGALGVAVFDGLVAAGLVDIGTGLSLTASGREWFATLVGEGALTPRSRPLMRTCLDWTERRSHLGGTLGAALCAEFLARSWVLRRGGERAVDLTPEGVAGIDRLLGRPDQCGLRRADNAAATTTRAAPTTAR